MKRLHWKLTYGVCSILLGISQALFASSEDGTEAIIGSGAFSLFLEVPAGNPIGSAEKILLS